METGTYRRLFKAIGRANLVIGAATVMLMGAACDPLYDPQHCRQVPRDTNSVRILAVGDSITAFWSREHANSCQAYSDYASEEIHEHIENHAIGGTELSGSSGKCIPVQYQEAAEASGSYDIVVLTAGGNDLRNECPLAEHETCSVKCRNKMLELADEMETLVTDIVHDGSDVVIVGYYPMRNESYGKYNECLAQISAEYEKLAAASPRVTFVKTADLVDTADESNYAFDEVHPSIKLTKAIGKRVAAAIMKR